MEALRFRFASSCASCLQPDLAYAVEIRSAKFVRSCILRVRWSKRSNVSKSESLSEIKECIKAIVRMLFRLGFRVGIAIQRSNLLLQSSFSKICYRIFWITFFERHAKIFDTLTRSMQELTRYADHISRALAEPKHKDKTAITTKDQHNLTVNEAHGLHLPLRPRIE